MTADLALREAHVEDALGIAKVQVETWQSTYPGIVPDAYLTNLSAAVEAIGWARIIDREPEKSATYVVCRGAEPLGFVSLGPSRTEDLPFSGEIYALYVLPDWQNRGLGRALLGRAFVSLMQSNINSALVWVLERNPSRFFYAAFGGLVVASAEEVYAGAKLRKSAYAWHDLEAWRQSQS